MKDVHRDVLLDESIVDNQQSINSLPTIPPWLPPITTIHPLFLPKSSLDSYYTYSPMRMSASYYLGIDITIHVLQGLGIIGNGFMTILFFKTPRLRRNMSLRLLMLLCITDLLFAVLSLPYAIYYTVRWDPIIFDYNSTFIIISSLPLVVQFKINLVITIMIGADRLQAMKLPGYYRRKNQNKFTLITLFIGIFFAVVDIIFEFITTKFDTKRYNCAAVGCFQADNFRTYWGISNMILNTIALILTLWVGIELKRIHTVSPAKSLTKKETKKMTQVRPCKSDANKLSFGILMISFFFLMIPSTFVGIVDFTNFHIFQVIGPFYIIGLLLAGIFNSILYLSLHVEIQNAALHLIKHRKFNKETSSNIQIGITTTVNTFDH